MGFLEDLTKKASGIVSKGKNFLDDQLSSETTYGRDASGNFQMTGNSNKPKIVNTAKEFLLPGRGYTDEQIKTAQPTTKEKIVGVSKAAGEIVQGGLSLVHMLGNTVADVVPGYDSKASAASRNKLNEKVSAKLAPKTAGEAKAMRVVDYAGFLPVGSVSKVGKLSKLDDLIKASNKTDAFKALKDNGFTDDAIRTGNLDTKIAGAADEVAVQNVLKDVMPPVKTSNKAPKLKSGLLTQKQIFQDLQSQGYSKQEISDALSLSKSQESLGTTAYDAEDVLSKLKTKSDSASTATTYRGASIKEWEDVKKNGTFTDREGTVMIDKKTGKPIQYDDAGKNTTTSKELADGYAKNSSNEGVTIEFKPEAKAKMRFSAKFESTDLQADEFLGEGLDINDVARVTDKNGNVIYESGSQSKKSNTSPIESVAKPAKLSKAKIVKSEFADPLTRFSITPGTTRLTPKQAAEMSKDTSFHGTDGAAALDILSSGGIKAKVSNLDQVREKVVSLSRNKNVSATYGDIVFEVDNTKLKSLKDAPKGVVNGDTFDGFEVRTNDDIPLDAIKTVHIIADSKQGDKFGLDFPVTRLGRQGRDTIIEEIGTYKDIVKAYEDAGIDVVVHQPESYLKSISKKSPVESVAKPAKQFDIPKKATGEVDVDTYVRQQTKLRESARGDKSISTRTTEFLQNLENKMVDFTSPIQRRVDKAKKSNPLAFGDKSDIKDNIDRVFNAPAITAAFVKEKGFAKAVQSIDAKDLDAFDQYLTAKHANDLNTKGIKTGRNAEADAALVAELEPKFENAAQEIQKYNNERLQYMVDSGLISKELKDELLTKHPNYVPFQRVFSEDELANTGGFGSSGVASLSKQSVVQKIVGSEREIESPLESLLELTNKAVQQGEKNKAALTLTSYADLPNNPFGLRKISKTTDAAADKDTISVLRDGKKEIWEVDADVAKAAKALDVERMNILGKILAFPLRVARLGITGVNVPFVAANVVRDQMSAFIMSDKGLRSSIANPKVFLPALGNAIGHGKLYDEMLSEGALMTSFDVVRDAVKPTLKSVMADKSKASKAMFIAKNPSQWFRAVEDAIGRSEEVTRMQQYLGNKKAALADGATEAEARTIAARAARENSTNFARRGEWGTVMNNTILYLNAGIQGSRLLIRNLKNKPIKTSAKIATTLMMPAASITYWNLSDPERKAAYEDIAEYEKENNFIIVPPNPVKEGGRWNVIKIPLPPGVGQFTNFVRRPIEQSQGLDEVSFAEAASNLLRVVSPTDLTNPVSSLTPQAIKPSVQAYTNKNLFTGYDVVPKSMQDLPVEQQVKDTTSGTATDIANTLGVSPIKTEQFINDTLGGVGPQILNAADRIRGEEVVGGRSISESVARRFNSAAGNKLEADQLDEIYSLKTEARGQSNELKKTADNTLAELRNMPKDQANVELKRIFEENRPLYDAINKARKAEDRGLTKVEAALEDLPVKDGTRAAYIYSEFLNIEKSSPEDAQAYIVELRKKKIISDEVFKQLKELKQLDTQ